MAVFYDDLIVSPRYHDMWVTLEATNAALNRGNIISIDETEYEASQSTVTVKTDANANKFYPHGGNTGKATRPFGILLHDVPKSDSSQSVHVLVNGTVNRAKIDAENGSNTPKVIDQTLVNALRYAGIICK